MSSVSINYVSNPLEPHNAHRYEAAPGTSVRAWLLDNLWLNKAHKEFDQPTVCLVNGKACLRAEWDRPLEAGDVVVLSTLLQGGLEFLLALTVITAVASVAIALTVPKPTVGTLPEPDPVYTLTGQANQTRLNSAIEVPYGRNRLWPSYAARPYTRYEDNQQFQFQILCLGQGSYDVEELRIEDTPAANFREVEFAYYGPGEAVTLFSNNVVTSPEVGGVELFGPNETDYASWIGGFVASGPGTLASKLEVDVVFPQGLYEMATDSSLGNSTVTAEFEYRLLDDDGAPAGSWTSLASLSKTLRTNTPQRFTLEATVAPGRYEVRARRTNDKNTSTRAADVLRWDALRAYLPDVADFGDVTVVAIKSRATNNLSDAASNRVNCIATRKLRAWDVDTQSWNAEAATRSLVWAFCDLFQAEYGGQLPDQYFDLDALAELDTTLSGEACYFDHVFDTSGSLWDAARVLARVCRGVPMLVGSQLTITRDTPASLPVAAFGPDNMVAGSFRLELSLSNLGESDAVEVEYVDPLTWQPETVVAMLGDDAGINPERVRFFGCKDRDRAFREGLHLRASRIYLRQQVSFKTELEGHLPVYGDLIAVSHDVPRWGSPGLVLAMDGTTVTLDADVTFPDGVTCYLALRAPDGSIAGPFPATAGSAANEVVLTVSPRDQYSFSRDVELPFYYFGPAEAAFKLAKVTNLQPDDDGRVAVTGLLYDARVYSFDSATAPALGTEPAPVVVPDAPTVDGLAVAYTTERGLMLVTWDAALGATYYTLQTSADGTTWTTVEAALTTTSFRLAVAYGTLYVRVAAGNVSLGAWDTWSGTVGTPAGVPDAVASVWLTAAFTGLSADVAWDAADGATGYTVQVFDAASMVLQRTASTTALAYSYTSAMSAADGGPVRSFYVTVTATNGTGDAVTSASVHCVNPTPEPATGLASELTTEDGSSATYGLSWDESTDADFSTFKVYSSAASGFTADGSTLVYTGSAAEFALVVAKVFGGHGARYWRVAALDVWGTEFRLTAEQVIAATPMTGSGFSGGFSTGFGA